MNAVKQDVENLVQKSLESANQKFPVFHSDYEGAAVIFREIENAKECMDSIVSEFEVVWAYIKIENRNSANRTKAVMNYAIELACSAIQVAAMAQKFIDSKKEREKSEDN